MSKNSFDTILENGTVYDGTGRPGLVADVGIVDDRIKHIGNLEDADSVQRINVQGLAVSPGFIDLHTHSDFTLVVDGSAESQVHQGVTTEVIGQCGHSVAPVCHHDEIAKRAIGFVAGSRSEHRVCRLGAHTLFPYTFLRGSDMAVHHCKVSASYVKWKCKSKGVQL